MEGTSDTVVRIAAHDLSLEQKLDALPARPGVYQFKNSEEKVIYVGKAQNLRNRVRQYFQKSHAPEPRIATMVSKIADVELTVTDTEVEALILEANLIKKLKPRYNVLLKDDKSYPYIVVTDEPFPRVFVTRKKAGRKARYFGPYTDVKSMRFALKTVRDIFMIRSCNFELTDESIAKGKFKVCLDYHIKKCEGPCEALVSREHYNAMIDQVVKVLRGRTNSVVEHLEEEMRNLSEHLRFEEAALMRDRIRALTVCNDKQKMVDSERIDRDIVAVVAQGDDACGVIFKIREGKVVGSQHFYLTNVEQKQESEILENLLERYYLETDDIPREILLSADVESAGLLSSWLRMRRNETISVQVPKGGEPSKLVAMARNNAQFWLDELEVQRLKRGDVVPHSVNALQRDLRLSAPPRRVECFDISNTQGSDSVASMVVFVDAKPRKSEYRKFKIRSVEGPNDFASMQEVIERRYSRVLQQGDAMPDLIMVDGGKGQLSSAVDVLTRLGITLVPIIGLAKKLEEVFVPEHSDPVQIPRTSHGLRLLQQIRDEAHRFAITYHRTLRSKRILQTELDLIKGVGKKRAGELLEAFGSVQGVKFATDDQLSEIVGEKVAEKIREYFGEENAGNPPS
ncbi:MAG: excinuclease ABC subunit UvrC [Bacteroidota bacterium]